MGSQDLLIIEKDAHDQACTDEDLIRCVRKGDSQAFEQLYKRYYLRLFRFVYRVVRRRDLIEEVINDAMFVVWQKADTFDATSRVSTWVFGIAYKKALKCLERFPPTKNGVSIEEIENVVPGNGEAVIKQIELDNWLDTAFEALSPDQRAVMELAYRQGMNYSEIAVAMGCPENTVKTRMFHARKKLRAHWPVLSAVPESSHS